MDICLDVRNVSIDFINAPGDFLVHQELEINF